MWQERNISSDTGSQAKKKSPEFAKNNRISFGTETIPGKKKTLVKCARNKRSNSNNKFVYTVQCELERLNFV